MFSFNEKAIAELLCRNISDEEIAERLFIKVEEVRQCKSQMLQKLERFGVKTNKEMIHFLKETYATV